MADANEEPMLLGIASTVVGGCNYWVTPSTGEPFSTPALFANAPDYNDWIRDTVTSVVGTTTTTTTTPSPTEVSPTTTEESFTTEASLTTTEESETTQQSSDSDSSDSSDSSSSSSSSSSGSSSSDDNAEGNVRKYGMDSLQSKNENGIDSAQMAIVLCVASLCFFGILCLGLYFGLKRKNRDFGQVASDELCEET